MVAVVVAVAVAAVVVAVAAAVAVVMAAAPFTSRPRPRRRRHHHHRHHRTLVCASELVEVCPGYEPTKALKNIKKSPKSSSTLTTQKQVIFDADNLKTNHLRR